MSFLTAALFTLIFLISNANPAPAAEISANRVAETSATTGTGTYSLSGARAGYQSFVSGIGNGNTCYYVVWEGTDLDGNGRLDWEVGYGTVTDASVDTLSRDTIQASSNSGAAVSWGTGLKYVHQTLTASEITALKTHAAGTGADHSDVAANTQKLSGIEAGAQVNPALVSQAEAEAGIAETGRTWSALRVAQAIAAWFSENFVAGTDYQTPLAADTDYLTPGTAADAYQPIGSYLTEEEDPDFAAWLLLYPSLDLDGTDDFSPSTLLADYGFGTADINSDGTLVRTPLYAAVASIKLTEDGGTALTIGDGKFHFFIPAALDGMILASVSAGCSTASTSGDPSFAVYNLTASQDLLAVNLTIDAGETHSVTAAVAAAIDADHDDVATGDELRIDCDVAGTGTAGVQIDLIFQMP